VPNTVVLTLVTFCLALVPVFGAGMFSFLVAVWLYLNGHLVPAIFLAAWSVLAVGLIDNLVKPLVIRGGIAMHGAVVFFALLGGVTVFGLAGVILGPLSVALLLAILRIYKRDFATPEERTG
jgi:predicted PurR-regulated permease PerM